MNTKKRTRKWDPWPVSIVAFFVVAILGCVAFVIFCNRHPADLVAGDYYEREVRYQKQIDSIHRASEAAERTMISYDPAGRSIVIALPSVDLKSNLTGTIQLYRPSAANLDRLVKLEPDHQGVQRIDAASLSPGLWKVRVSWNAERKDYFIDQSIVIEGKAS